jgi:hypothetical protein
VTEHDDHAPWHSRKKKTKLPVYFKHPKTGIIVEVDTAGLITIDGTEIGPFRSWHDMKDQTGQTWNAELEIDVLSNAYWKRI